ncbi:MAG: hypothetical protein QM640_02175 [Niabella sp.]
MPSYLLLPVMALVRSAFRRTFVAVCFTIAFIIAVAGCSGFGFCFFYDYATVLLILKAKPKIAISKNFFIVFRFFFYKISPGFTHGQLIIKINQFLHQPVQYRELVTKNTGKAAVFSNRKRPIGPPIF